MIKLKNLLTENAKLPHDIRARVLKVLKQNKVDNFTVDKGTDYNETTDDYILKMNNISQSELRDIVDDLMYMDILIVSSHYKRNTGIVTFDV